VRVGKTECQQICVCSTNNSTNKVSKKLWVKNLDELDSARAPVGTYFQPSSNRQHPQVDVALAILNFFEFVFPAQKSHCSDAPESSMPPPSGRRGDMGMLGRTLQDKATRRPKKIPHCWLDLEKLLELLIFQLEVPTPTSPNLDIGCWKIAVGSDFWGSLAESITCHFTPHQTKVLKY